MYHDLRDFMAQLEHDGALRRVDQPVSPHLDMTAVCDQVLRHAGPALLFTHPTGHDIPVLANLFGTPQRIMHAMGVHSLQEVRQLGELLGNLREPSAPQRLRDVAGMGHMLRSLWHMAPRTIGQPPCQTR